jgi:hypothetical protein
MRNLCIISALYLHNLRNFRSNVHCVNCVNCVNGVKCIIMHTLSVICIIMPIMREHPGRFPEPTRVLAHNWYNFAIYTNNAGGVRNNVGGVRN